LRKLTADIIYSGNRGWLKDTVILVDHTGQILSLKDRSEFQPNEYEYYPGMLVPGFINAHCHLELSHLHGKFQTGTQLLPFLKSVVQNREVDPDFVLQKIKEGDEEMWKEGIVAVGDISNKVDTKACKEASSIYYHTFVEAFDFLQDSLANSFFETYKSVYDAFGHLPKTMVPHAPYSVSKSLFSKINALNTGFSNISSIHNQECIDEDLLFLNKTGGFVEFWESFGFSMKDFEPIGKDSVSYTINHLDPYHPVLFIHNTQTRLHHIQSILQWNPASYFVTCPNANLFIENQLPDYTQFKNAIVCIGTDSLSSNWQLSILSEIKTILKYQSYLSLDEVLRWATYHGAMALNISDWAGSLDAGKKPGINWIQDVEHNGTDWLIKPEASVYKIS